MAGPYDQSGLSEGFAQGFGLALKKLEGDRENRESEERLKSVRAEREAAAKRLDIETERYNYEVSGRAAKEASDRVDTEYKKNLLTAAKVAADKAALELDRDRRFGDKEAQLRLDESSARVRAANANAAESRGNARSRELANNVTENLISSKRELAKLAEQRVKSLPEEAFTDPSFHQDVGVVDAFVNFGRIDPKNPPSGDKFLRVLNVGFKRELSQWNGVELDDTEAGHLGVPKGSVVVDAQAADIQFNKDEKNVIISVAKTVRLPDGRIVRTKPLHIANTRNARGHRNISPDEEPVTIPLKRISEFAQGFGILSNEIQKRAASGNPLTRDELLAEIRANADEEAYSALNPKTVSQGRAGVYNAASGDLLVDRSSDTIQTEYLKSRTRILGNPNLTESQKEAALLDLEETFSSQKGPRLGSGFDRSTNNPTVIGGSSSGSGTPATGGKKDHAAFFNQFKQQ